MEDKVIEDHAEGVDGEVQKNQKPLIVSGVQGCVKWFNIRKRYGFVNRNDTKEDIFVHQSAIVRLSKSRIRSIRETELVQFDVVQGAKGPEVANLTGPDGAPVKGARYSRKFAPRNRTPNKLSETREFTDHTPPPRERMDPYYAYGPSQYGYIHDPRSMHRPPFYPPMDNYRNGPPMRGSRWSNGPRYMPRQLPYQDYGRPDGRMYDRPQMPPFEVNQSHPLRRPPRVFVSRPRRPDQEVGFGTGDEFARRGRRNRNRRRGNRKSPHERGDSTNNGPESAASEGNQSGVENQIESTTGEGDTPTKNSGKKYKRRNSGKNKKDESLKDKLVKDEKEVDKVCNGVTQLDIQDHQVQSTN